MTVRIETPLRLTRSQRRTQENFLMWSDKTSRDRLLISLDKAWENPERHRRTSESLMGHKVSDLTRERISKTKKEKNKERVIRLTDDHKKNISMAHKTRMQTDPEYQTMVKKRNKEIANRPDVIAKRVRSRKANKVLLKLKKAQIFIDITSERKLSKTEFEMLKEALSS